MDGKIDFSQVTSVDNESSERQSVALAYLADTDWYFIRNLETGEKIPDEVLQKRASARKTMEDAT